MSAAEKRLTEFLGRLPYLAYLGIAAVLFVAAHADKILAFI